MEQCSGLSGDWHRITWYAVPGNSFPTHHDDYTVGLWVEPHTIYVTESVLTPRPWGSEPTLVPHEMLHDLLQRDGHPPAFEACGV